MQISNHSQCYPENEVPYLFISKLPFLISKNYDPKTIPERGIILLPLTTEVIISFIKDDLDYFLKLSKPDTNFTNFGFYFEERPDDLYSFINVAAYYGSVNIFKYCISSQTNFIILPQFVIAGGSKEILRICEQQGIKLVDYAVIALLYRRDDIYEWLLEKVRKYPSNQLYFCTETYSIKKFYEFCQLNKKALNNSYFIPFLIENMKEEIKLFAEHIIPTYDNVFLTKDSETLTNLFKNIEEKNIINLFYRFLDNNDEFHMNLFLQTHSFNYFTLDTHSLEKIKTKFPNLYQNLLIGAQNLLKNDVRPPHICNNFVSPSDADFYLEIVAEKKDMDNFIQIINEFKNNVSVNAAVNIVKTYDLIWPSVFYHFSDEIIKSDKLISDMIKHINLEKMSYIESKYQKSGKQRNSFIDLMNYKSYFRTFVQKSLAYLNELNPLKICNLMILTFQYAPDCMKNFNLFQITDCQTLDDYIYQVVNNKTFFSPFLENIESCKSLIAVDHRFIMGMSSLASNKEFVEYAIPLIGRSEHRSYLHKFLMNPEIKKHYTVQELYANVSRTNSILFDYIELTKEEFDFVHNENKKAANRLYKNPKNAVYVPKDKVLNYAMTTGNYGSLEHIKLTTKNIASIEKLSTARSSFPLIRNEDFRTNIHTNFIINLLNSNTKLINTEDAILAINELITRRKSEFQENKIIPWFKYIIKCYKLTEFLKIAEGILDKSTLFEIYQRCHYPFNLNGVQIDLNNIEKFDGKTVKSIYENFQVPHDYHMKYLLQVIKHEDSPDIIDYIFSQSKMNIDVFVDKTPLQIAVKYNRPQTVLYLLNKGAKAGYIGECTCLSLTDDEEMKKILLPHADIEENNKYLISVSNDNDVDFLIKCKKFIKSNDNIVNNIHFHFNHTMFVEYLFSWEVSLEEAFSYLIPMVQENKII
ncbi:hypothetical protein TVAG_379670 [Trichomonas vaginalis G3]|uniref:DUF3447 domain-containing protein n=1 Tax=Trichomonas vaginalis (strain ATCC PRA-98 / G3) TaxID=412133 RepID=A2E7J2_TRIV3|nr:Ankyrin repeat family [Trichomonas vaginalis G3]EAY11385.1 hypothetical protein TVAG_379670 [Trichomonas vaginalis G3]KAI5530550.1 Ankyrin repeat family [Trichomonas vaginalis G3]|eukprot:XP_001323608.1 hypothetical protein [Trichomonas vaginalis G3]